MVYSKQHLSGIGFILKFDAFVLPFYMASIALYLYWIYTQGLYIHIIRGTLPLDAPHNMIYTPCFFTYKFRQLLVSPYASVFWALSRSVPKISMSYGLCQIYAFSLLFFSGILKRAIYVGIEGVKR